VSSKDVEIHEVIKELSMEGPIKIAQSSSPWLTLTFVIQPTMHKLIMAK
jgi:hypothetical protein